MNETELMNAIIVGATAFAGLTGVIVGQITVSKLSHAKKKSLKNLLAWSFGAGVVAVASTIAWLWPLPPLPLLWKGLASVTFVAQLLWFWVVAFRLWHIE
jgi:hypothetical protein